MFWIIDCEMSFLWEKRKLMIVHKTLGEFRIGTDQGHVTISADISDDTVSISVSDEGPGVEGSQLEKIFELGYRTDSARQNPAGGSGIGLAVVKRAAEQMHGSVKAENLDGGGLCVTITMPRTQEV